MVPNWRSPDSRNAAGSLRIFNSYRESPVRLNCNQIFFPCEDRYYSILVYTIVEHTEVSSCVDLIWFVAFGQIHKSILDFPVMHIEKLSKEVEDDRGDDQNSKGPSIAIAKSSSIWWIWSYNYQNRRFGATISITMAIRMKNLPFSLICIGLDPVNFAATAFQSLLNQSGFNPATSTATNPLPAEFVCLSLLDSPKASTLLCWKRTASPAHYKWPLSFVSVLLQTTAIGGLSSYSIRVAGSGHCMQVGHRNSSFYPWLLLPFLFVLQQYLGANFGWPFGRQHSQDWRGILLSCRLPLNNWEMD